MSPHEFVIPVRDLDAGGKGFRFPIRTAWLRGALEGTAIGPAPSGGRDGGPDADEGELDVRASKSGTDVLVRGSLRARLVVACARCLEPAEVAVDEVVTALAVPAPASAPSKRAGAASEEELEAVEEPDTITFDGETVVLDDLVRDELILAVPMIPLCSPSCAGISVGPQGGEKRPGDAGTEDAAVDPRLRALLRLKKT